MAALRGASERAAFLASLGTGFVTREAKLMVDWPRSGPVLARAPPVDRLELDILGFGWWCRDAEGSLEGLFVGWSLMDRTQR